MLMTIKQPKSRGCPPKHFHPLLKKEKDVNTILHEILPQNITDSLSPKGSRLAHLYGLSKTHKADLSMSGLFYRQLEHIITAWLNGWKKD